MNKKPLAIACMATFTYVSALALVIPFLPFQVLKFGGSYAYAGGIFSAFSAASFLSAPLWGRACENWGIRKTLLISGTLTICSYYGLFIATSLQELYAARILAGLSAGWLIACQTLVAKSTNEEQRTKGLGLLGAAFGCGFASGHILSAWLIGANLAPSKTPVLAACFLSLLACLIAMFIVTPKENKNAQTLASRRWRNILAMLNTKPLAIIILIYFLISLLFHGFEGIFALWVEEAFAFGPRKVASLLAYSSIIVILVQGGIVGVLARRYGERVVVLWGLVFLLFGFAGLAVAINIAVLLGALTLVAVGISLNNPAIQSLMSKGSKSQGDGFGLLQSFASLSRMFAPFGFALLASIWGGRLLFITFACTYLLIFFATTNFSLLPKKA